MRHQLRCAVLAETNARARCASACGGAVLERGAGTVPRGQALPSGTVPASGGGSTARSLRRRRTKAIATVVARCVHRAAVASPRASRSYPCLGLRIFSSRRQAPEAAPPAQDKKPKELLKSVPRPDEVRWPVLSPSACHELRPDVRTAHGPCGPQRAGRVAHLRTHLQAHGRRTGVPAPSPIGGRARARARALVVMRRGVAWHAAAASGSRVRPAA